ncbi:hypothetical protein [Longispora fulva]|uniref:Uncharacterized protein n=1 Tax=Longispora fulva TaxID=619741 RepID=A0A8J7KUC4_9ACTN|nr:hypothetical protein [Longispora fulva]MBG6133907.1 hypothetical protein [Longispora fulva]
MVGVAPDDDPGVDHCGAERGRGGGEPEAAAVLVGDPRAEDTRTWFVARGVPPNSTVARYWDDAGIDRSKVMISRFDYFGHSSSDAFFLQYGWKNAKGDPANVRGEAIITKDRLDQRLADAGAFAPGAVAHLWGCYLAADMAQVLRKYVSKVIAAEGRTDYEGLVGNPAALPAPADQGSWTVLAAADPDPAVPVSPSPSSRATAACRRSPHTSSR